MGEAVSETMHGMTPCRSLSGHPHVQTRGSWAPAVAVMLVLCFAFWSGLAAAQTEVYDPKTRTWVRYDRTKAYQYYRQHNDVPEPFRRQIVKFRTAEEPGTIIIDGNQHFLYLVEPNQQAIRYGIGVGRE